MVGLPVVTSGTVGRALATWSCTLEPLVTLVLAAGDCLTTVPGACELSTSDTSAVSPSDCSCDSASSREEPTRFGTGTPCEPLETVKVTVRPLVACWPAAGETEITLP